MIMLNCRSREDKKRQGGGYMLNMLKSKCRSLTEEIVERSSIMPPLTRQNAQEVCACIVEMMLNYCKMVEIMLNRSMLRLNL